MSPRASTIVISLGLLVSAARGQELPGGYEIVQLTDTPWREMFPSINNRGQIAYIARPAGPETQEMFLYEPTTGETLQITHDDYGDVAPQINDEGVIVWTRGPWQMPWGDIMMRTPDGVVTPFISNGLYNHDVAINNAGQLAWVQHNRTGCAQNGTAVMFFDGQTVRNIWENDLYNQGPRLNEHGDIVWTEMNVCGGTYWTSLIKLYIDGQILTLSQPGRQSQSCDLNDDRIVVWRSSDLTTGEEGIYQWRDGQVQRLFDRGHYPRLNNRGDIAFHAWDDVRNTWDVWLQGPDRLYALTRETNWNVDPSINDAGEIVWEATASGSNKNLKLIRKMSLGDLNCDGAIDTFDIEPFITALLSPTEYLARYPTCDPSLADIDQDGAVNAFDIEPFAQLILP